MSSSLTPTTLTVSGTATLATTTLVGSNYAVGGSASGAKIVAGTISWTMNSQVTTNLSFTSQFSFTSAPRVFIQMSTGGFANFVTTQVETVTTTGFTVWAYQSQATGSQTYTASFLAYGS